VPQALHGSEIYKAETAHSGIEAPSRTDLNGDTGWPNRPKNAGPILGPVKEAIAGLRSTKPLSRVHRAAVDRSGGNLVFVLQSKSG
jgi:hypothetical protein